MSSLHEFDTEAVDVVNGPGDERNSKGQRRGRNHHVHGATAWTATLSSLTSAK